MKNSLEDHINIMKRFDLDIIQKVAEITANSFKNDGILYAFGNGGSAADANHFVAELTSTGFRAISLPANPSSVTAIGNDFAFDEIFSRQLSLRKNDIIYAFSTSGTSPNILKAVLKAKEAGCITIGMTSKKNGNKMTQLVDYAIIAPTTDTQRSQEYHLFAYHEIWKYILQKK